jgi:hypothetical protein
MDEIPVELVASGFGKYGKLHQTDQILNPPEDDPIVPDCIFKVQAENYQQKKRPENNFQE